MQGSAGRRTMALAAAAIVVVALCARDASASPGAVSAAALWRAQANGTTRVLVRFAVPAAPEGRLPTLAAVGQQRQDIAQARGDVLSALAGTRYTVARQFDTIPFVALEASEGALAALERSGRVAAVEEDRLFRPLLEGNVTLVEADQAWAEGFDGSGWTVAIVDTGVDATHPMLSGKILDEACFSQNGNCPNGQSQQTGAGAAVPCGYDANACGHGTHVAGIAAGNWPAQNLFGVARGANVLAAQVFSRFDDAADCGSANTTCALAYTSDIVAGVEWVYSLRDQQHIAAVNLSLGTDVFASTAACDSSNAAMKAAIDNLVSVGIATAAAAGNDGNAQGLEAPGCISSAVSVGSTNLNDQISSFSDSATFLSLLAPGESIRSAFPGDGIATGSGTSEAAPHVAGAWAILKQKVPDAPVSTVLGALRSTGLPLTDSRNGVTTPRIQVREALDSIASTGRQSGIQVTPDNKRTLISKDVGGERWAVTYNTDDRTVTGNVYSAAGGEPQFVWCQRVSDDGNPDPSQIQIQFSCDGAESCASSDCAASSWTFIANVTLPGSFFQP